MDNKHIKLKCGQLTKLKTSMILKLKANTYILLQTRGAAATLSFDYPCVLLPERSSLAFGRSLSAL